MSPNFKRIITQIIFNSSLFLMLFVGIQNSTTKSKVNLIIDETVHLPLGFIVGVSFIFGSISGNLISINLINKKEFSS